VSAQARRVLVVTDGVSDSLPETLHERVARTRAEVLVVGPALPAPSRAAEDRVRRCVEHLRLAGYDAEGMVGDPDPAQAIEDALAVFEADAVVADADIAARARRRVGLPIVSLRAAA
jgi:hypothetical protein